MIVSIREEHPLTSSTKSPSNSTCIPMLSPQTPHHKLTPGRHQRQNSTPTKFGTPQHVSPVTHRRGLSTDQLSYAHRNHGLPHQDLTYEGVEFTLGQQLTQTATMREAQQQLMARPGLDQNTTYEQFDYAQALKPMPCLEHGHEDFRDNYSTPTTEIEQHIRQSLPEIYNLNSMEFSQFDLTTPAGNLDGFGNGLEGQGSIQPNQLMDMKSMPHGIRSPVRSRPTSSEGVQQPCTPPSQMRTSNTSSTLFVYAISDIVAGYFPMTPATTPYSQNAKFRGFPQSRTAESSPTRRDPNLTIKASHEMQRGTSCQDNFAAMRQHAMSPDIPSPTHTAPLELRRSVDLAPFPQPNLFNMSSLTTDMPPWEGGYNPSNYSPMSNAVSSSVSSFQSSPELTHMSLFETRDESIHRQLRVTNSSRLPTSQSSMDLGNYSPPAKQDQQARSQSMSQLEELTECIEETGVTCDEIASFISFSDAANKWTCLYPSCGKESPRKENIKAHVQTHLDDRQFRCKDCSKRFVRQHDLKRHMNIHSRKRIYGCACGRTFARHDALTRHRQRGCCIGAFEGATKKIIKRGRPKKPRAEAGDRAEKSAATRQRALEKLEKRSPGKYASSICESSASAYSSPEQFSSPPEQASSPPELDISSSSPAASRSFESESTLSQTMPYALGSSSDLYEPDFDLSHSIAKYVAHKDINESLFKDFLSEEIEEAATFNDFDFSNEL